MSLETALRLTEILLACVLLQAALEHLVSRQGSEAFLFLPRFPLCAFLILGVFPNWICLALLLHYLAVLQRFDGPYNGGSDRMALLILVTLTAAHFAPDWRELAFAYLALQLLLSYFMSGWVKLKNLEWQSGRALRDVFQYSAYPVSLSLREYADQPRLMTAASRWVIGFELMFPLVLLHPLLMAAGLSMALAFHLANACLFGLNRFVWTWLAAYPSIIWFQMRLSG
ncbi:MAG: HTTM domain-containing protein [Pseudomonadota bacterium]